jgi:hypothetical protein
MVFLQNPLSIIYFYYAIKDWNLLPNTLNNIKNLDEFKNLELNNSYQKREETILIMNIYLIDKIYYLILVYFKLINLF